MPKVPPQRIVHVERMCLPHPPPDHHVETRITPDGTGTLLTVTMTLANLQDRDARLASGMTGGLDDSYIQLETLPESA